MELPDELKLKSQDELEEWFLDALEKTPLPLREMVAVLHVLRERSRTEQANGCAELLQDTLIGRGDRTAALALLQLRGEWMEDRSAFARLCEQTARAACRDRLGAGFVKNVGFGADLSPDESLRRLRTLDALGEGALCHDKTWGFGVVRRLDDFYEKVTVDFTAKPNHAMSFAYAAETLELIDESHLHARRYRNPEGFSELVQSDPAEVVRIALRSYGPLSVPLLQEALEDFVDEADWKRFWDAARRGLKADPLADLPARRSEPIRLLDKEKNYEDEWLSALAAERDMSTILRLAEELRTQIRGGELTDEQKGIVLDRLAFTVKGAGVRHAGLMASAVLAARRLGLGADDSRIERAARRLTDPEVFVRASDAIRAREMEDLISLVWTLDADGAGGTFLSRLAEMKFAVVNHVLAALVEHGLTDACKEVLHDCVRMGQPSITLVFWICRRLQTPERWDIIPLADMLTVAVECLGQEANGDQLRSQNQLRALFERNDWLELVLAELNHVQRLGLMNRITGARAWDVSGQRSMLAKFIRLYPELLQAVVSEGEDASNTKRPARYTSWRTYRERQEQLRHLVEVDIPENSREIGVARSYGDLRENFEYQAAKEHQRVLMQRQREMEQDLLEVKGIAFEGVSAEQAGMGTVVVICGPDGTDTRYCILGEWDRDEALGILPCGSRVAQILEGHTPGDDVELPAEEGTETFRIVAVEPLPEEVRAWASGPVDTSDGM